jgi:hypothetical protein
MVDPFRFHRVFCSTPGSLDEEQRIFLNALAEANEREGLAEKRLFVPVICLGAANTGAYNGAIRENVRDADFFVQILGHSWGVESAEFEDLFYYAIDCRDSAGLPMREVVVFLKDVAPGRMKPAVAQFRESLAGTQGIEKHEFSESEQLMSGLLSLLTGWLTALCE